MVPKDDLLEEGLVPEAGIQTSPLRSTISHDLAPSSPAPDPLNELSQQLSQLLAIMTMQQKEQNALWEELATIKADRQNRQVANSIKFEENKPCLEQRLTSNERLGRTRCVSRPWVDCGSKVLP
ncbi:hypothetical protein M231_05519 [Tremella mesenterica]|uniref:Uncharacterized protein n=1 Tax=Tremella mesenterica TaxID=5217 RepID=A0A4Q1BHX3_TREME|nr:hypothetical protein M231_05519 [Tremella mesenterica]